MLTAKLIDKLNHSYQELGIKIVFSDVKCLLLQ